MTACLCGSSMCVVHLVVAAGVWVGSWVWVGVEGVARSGTVCISGDSHCASVVNGMLAMWRKKEIATRESGQGIRLVRV